jgi:hypothetical protein
VPGLEPLLTYGFHPAAAIIDHYQALGRLDPLHQGAQADGYVVSAVHFKEHLAPMHELTFGLHSQQSYPQERHPFNPLALPP